MEIDPEPRTWAQSFRIFIESGMIVLSTSTWGYPTHLYLVHPLIALTGVSYLRLKMFLTYASQPPTNGLQKQKLEIAASLYTNYIFWPKQIILYFVIFRIVNSS